MTRTTITLEQARRERLQEGGMDEATATALSDALTSLGNEITQKLEAKLDRLLIVIGVGFAALAVMAIIIMVVAGDSGQDIHYYGTPTPPVAVPVGFTPAS